MKNKPKISLLLPTRGRPGLVRRFFMSAADTAFQPDQLEVVLYIDEDDPESHGLMFDTIRITRIIGPRVTMGKCNSACYKAAQGDIIFLVNDDMVFRTPGWDARVLEADAQFPDKIYLAYGNDLYQKKNLCTFPILSRKTCQLLIDPFPSQYHGAMIDLHLLDIFRRLQHAGFDRICYMGQVIFEHLHFKAGKACMDTTYEKRGRYSDDPIFLSLIGFRKDSASMLKQILLGQKREAAQRYGSGEQAFSPRTLIQAMQGYTRLFLLDGELPLKWKSYLWILYVGRYVKEKGILRAFQPGFRS